MNRWLLAAALIFPLVGLLASIAAQEMGERGATEWQIPIAGYDPRDPLRGRFIAFRYDWTVSGPAHLCRESDCMLCLEQAGRHIRVIPRGGECPARIDPLVSRITLTHGPGFGADGQPLVAMSRLFVSEASAPRLEALLRQGPMIVHARLTRDGRLINDRLEPTGRETP